MDTVPLKRNYLNRYLTSVRSQGRYIFTLDELREQFDLSDIAINQSLGRLKAKYDYITLSYRPWQPPLQR